MALKTTLTIRMIITLIALVIALFMKVEKKNKYIAAAFDLLNREA